MVSIIGKRLSKSFVNKNAVTSVERLLKGLLPRPEELELIH